MARPPINLLLNAYVKQAGNAFLSRLEAVPMPFKAPLFRPGERPRFLHFVTSGIASLVALLEEGAEVEVSMTGNEGCPEAVYLLGPALSPRSCFMQVAGTALRIPFAEAEALFESDVVFRRLILRFVQFQSMMSTQLTACNGQHDAEERLARWLLMVEERLDGPVLPLTQEFLAQMLGSRRSTVTIAASNLQRAGIIDYRRGHVKILDHERLVDTACECYGMISRMFHALYKG